MKYGFTTGSCAAAASGAAAYMLLTGKTKTDITVETPSGRIFKAAILDIKRSENSVSCAVRKTAGDDPDITDGALIYSEVSIRESGFSIDGGKGVGRVTRPGLDQPVGAAAINRVPREMIEKKVSEVCSFTGYSGGLKIIISVPEGERLAEKTFNPKLGIAGGISILGTSGIVEPMSERAFIETIRLELKQKRAEGERRAVISPGNYGREFMKKSYGFDLDRSVKCGNFIGLTVDMAKEEGFGELLLVGHIGKLIKVAGGIMNTHSREADCRMEILASLALLCGADGGTARSILRCALTDEAVEILDEAGIKQAVMDMAVERICGNLERRTEKMKIECMIFSNKFGELGKSREAEKWFIS
ncbi:MAG TPA: cobalt-precorrin-5B (C(1))-methyltransferase CbiD [Firmicutes bacterium]|nr:cobalt-precorrin-5B (C(1))-methyltransferase CbiD [Bacillota bacterium]